MNLWYPRKRRVFPFTAVIGQEEMKLALLLNVIDPRIGGVMIMGDRGTANPPPSVLWRICCRTSTWWPVILTTAQPRIRTCRAARCVSGRSRVRR